MKLDIMRFLLLFASLGVAQTYFLVQNNYSLAIFGQSIENPLKAAKSREREV